MPSMKHNIFSRGLGNLKLPLSLPAKLRRKTKLVPKLKPSGAPTPRRSSATNNDSNIPGKLGLDSELESDHARTLRASQSPVRVNTSNYVQLQLPEGDNFHLEQETESKPVPELDIITPSVTLKQTIPPLPSHTQTQSQTLSDEELLKSALLGGFNGRPQVSLPPGKLMSLIEKLPKEFDVGQTLIIQGSGLDSVNSLEEMALANQVYGRGASGSKKRRKPIPEEFRNPIPSRLESRWSSLQTGGLPVRLPETNLTSTIPFPPLCDSRERSMNTFKEYVMWTQRWTQKEVQSLGPDFDHYLRDVNQSFLRLQDAFDRVNRFDQPGSSFLTGHGSYGITNCTNPRKRSRDEDVNGVDPIEEPARKIPALTNGVSTCREYNNTVHSSAYSRIPFRSSHYPDERISPALNPEFHRGTPFPSYNAIDTPAYGSWKSNYADMDAESIRTFTEDGHGDGDSLYDQYDDSSSSFSESEEYRSRGLGYQDIALDLATPAHPLAFPSIPLAHPDGLWNTRMPLPIEVIPFQPFGQNSDQYQSNPTGVSFSFSHSYEYTSSPAPLPDLATHYNSAYIEEVVDHASPPRLPIMDRSHV